MKKIKLIGYLFLITIILLYASYYIFGHDYPKFNRIKSFNPDALLNSKNSVELIIESEFDNYLLQQNVWIKVDLINNTDFNYYSVESISPGSLLFSIIDPDGNSIKSTLNTTRSIGDTVFIVKKGERYQSIISLEHYLYSHNYKPGTYKISCGFYRNSNKPYLKSNTIEIQVLQPRRDDKELYDITNRLKVWPKNKDELIKLRNLLDHYSENVYTPQLYTWLITFSNSEDCNSIFESSCEKYFKKYMNFFETEHILTEYAVYLKRNKRLSNDEMDKIIYNLAYKNKAEKSKIIFDSFSQLIYKQIKERNE